MVIAHQICVQNTIQQCDLYVQQAKHYRASNEVIIMTESTTLEQIVQELQIVAQQLVSVQTQVRELEATMTHLSNQIDGNSVYQQVGPLLVEVDDLDALNQSLSETCSQLSEHADKLTLRESELRTAYESAVKQFESS